MSCIPPGSYRLVLHDTEAHPRSFALVNEDLGVFHLNAPTNAGRTACLIHAANVPEELRGCIALGMSRGVDRINSSRIAIDRFYSLVPWIAGHMLNIRGPI